MELRNLRRRAERDLIDAGVQYRLHAEKPQFDTTTVAYHQTVFGLPVWEAGLAVHVRHPNSKHEQFRIVGAQSTRHAKIRVKKPSAKPLSRLKQLEAPALAKLLGMTGTRLAAEAKSLRILRRRLMAIATKNRNASRGRNA